MGLAEYLGHYYPGYPPPSPPCPVLYSFPCSVLTPLAWLPVVRCLVSPLQGGQDSSLLLCQLRG